MRSIALFILIILFLWIAPVHGTERITLAVLDLEGLNIPPGESSVFSEKIHDEVVNTVRDPGKVELEVLKADTIDVLERKKLREIYEEIDLTTPICTDSECALEIGRIARADYVIIGSVSLLRNLYSISLRMIEVATGKVVSSATVERKGDIEKLFSESSKKVVYNLFEIRETSYRLFYIGGVTVVAGIAGYVVWRIIKEMKGTLVVRVPATS
jgi:hypothetical protein